MKKKKIITLVLMIIVTTLFFVAGQTGSRKEKENMLPPSTSLGGKESVLSTSTPLGFETSRRTATIIPSTTKEGYNIYTSKKYGIQFSYPKEWVDPNVQEGFVPEGWLSFTNYDITAATAPYYFTETDGRGKIIVSLFDHHRSYDDEIKNLVAKEGVKQESITIAGQPAMRFDLTETEPGPTHHVRIYYIKPKDGAHPNNYPSFAVHGDPINYPVLDEIVRSITWLPLER